MDLQWFGLVNRIMKPKHIQSSNQLLQSYLDSTNIMHMHVKENCTNNSDQVHPNMESATQQVQQMMMDFMLEHSRKMEDIL